MALNATAREANYRDSIKKFLVDNLKTVEGIYLTFDKTLATPNIRGRVVKRWITVGFGSMARGTMSDSVFELYCCTRQDNEGFKLAQLGDKVMGYLTNSTNTDVPAYIPFYQSHPTQAWTLLGGIVIQSIIESDEYETEDETKVKLFTVRTRFASVV